MENQKRYQIELIGSLSHESQYGKFERGRSSVITNRGAVEYFRAQPEFLVTRLRDPKPAVVVTPKAVERESVRPAKGSKAPPPPVDEDDDEEEDDDEDDSDSEDESDDEETDDETEEEEEASDEYAKSSLAPLTKAALVELARSEFKLKLNDEASKPQIIQAILRAQLAKKGG